MAISFVLSHRILCARYATVYSASADLLGCCFLMAFLCSLSHILNILLVALVYAVDLVYVILCSGWLGGVVMWSSFSIQGPQ